MLAMINLPTCDHGVYECCGRKHRKLRRVDGRVCSIVIGQHLNASMSTHAGCVGSAIHMHLHFIRIEAMFLDRTTPATNIANPTCIAPAALSACDHLLYMQGRVFRRHSLQWRALQHVPVLWYDVSALNPSMEISGATAPSAALAPATSEQMIPREPLLSQS
jgi:hypothetical protein